MTKEGLEALQEDVTITSSKGTVHLTQDELFWLLANARYGARVAAEDAMDRRMEFDYKSDDWNELTRIMDAYNKQWFLYMKLDDSICVV